MPRKLPWASGFATQTPSKKSTSSDMSVKRKKVEKPASKSDSDKDSIPSKEGRSGSRAPSTSPPPEPPSESFMDEGIEKDDKYRMVEDEFLSVAQQFTVHLHTAEYKRQEKLVKIRNAQTISSISRPVVGKMPDHTKRRVEGAKLAKTQRDAVAALTAKKSAASDDSDDGDGLPYIGTTLHGLMDSPRRKAASLAKVTSASAATTTRSAAGFKRPAGQSKNAISRSPRPKSAPKVSRMASPNNDSSTESSDGEDDLDAPIPAPRFTKVDAKSPITSEASSKSRAMSGYIVQTTKKVVPTPTSSLSVSAKVPVKQEDKTRTRFPEITRASASNGPRVSRVEQARRFKAQQEEKEQKAKKNLDVIPSFL